jgi:hypothetical protein
MKTILAKVTVVRQPIEGERTIDMEWQQDIKNNWDPEKPLKMGRSISIEDNNGEFKIGDEVGISISKVR